MKQYLWLSIVLIAASCGDGNEIINPKEESDGKNRVVILTHIADQIIKPSYAEFKSVFDEMSVKSNAFTTKPTIATLVEFRESWVKAYTAWQRVELFDFGPADRETLRNYFNIYPANDKAIMENIDNPNANLEVAASFAQQGFPALDFLINGVGNSDEEILAFYNSNKEMGEKRLAYLNRLNQRMNTLLGKVLSEWNGSYRDNFIANTGLDIGSSTSALVNGLVLHYERFMRSGKFGIPSGAMLNGVISPEKVEAFYKKDLSQILAKTAHKAFVDFFNGKGATTGIAGPSIKTYLNELDAKDMISGQKLSDLINVQFDIVTSKIDGLQPSFFAIVNNNNNEMIEVYKAMQGVTKMLKVDMTSAMSITITYTDNDGD